MQRLVVKVPAVIDEPDDDLRKLKWRALRAVMREAQFLGNMAIRYSIAFNTGLVQEEIDDKKGKPIPIDTRIYRMLAEKRKHVPSGLMATLARNHAAKMFKTANKDAWAGRKSLPTIRNPLLPIRHSGTSITSYDEGKATQFIVRADGFTSLLRDELIQELSDIDPLTVAKEKRGIVFKSVFSWKDGGSVELLNRIVKGELKMSDSLLELRQGKLMFSIVYTPEEHKAGLDPDKICGVDLGVVIPAVCALKDGPQRRYLGDGDDVWAVRSKFRSQRRREQRRFGLSSKSVKWKTSEHEDRWIRTYYHMLTREVIKFCLYHGCGTIHMENLTDLRQKDMESEFRRLMWVPSKFKELLTYKAEIEGIEIVFVNPRNTSRRCSVCGHIEKDNRKSQKDFVCLKCGKSMQADYNAAKNIALASGDVIENGYIAASDDADSISGGPIGG